VVHEGVFVLDDVVLWCVGVVGRVHVYHVEGFGELLPLLALDLGLDVGEGALGRYDHVWGDLVSVCGGMVGVLNRHHRVCRLFDLHERGGSTGLVDLLSAGVMPAASLFRPMAVTKQLLLL
jgi:hypothetical protein